VQVKACLVIKQPKFGIYTGFSVPLLIQCVKSIDKKRAMFAGFLARVLLERCCLELIYLG
jgi:hypothetical protein